MKRYRVISQDFDTRARILSIEIQDWWEEDVKTSWLRNKEQLIQEIASEFGPLYLQQKLQNLVDLDAAPFPSVPTCLRQQTLS